MLCIVVRSGLHLCEFDDLMLDAIKDVKKLATQQARKKAMKKQARYFCF